MGIKTDFRTACKLRGLPDPSPEYPFAKDIGRRWRMDWAWPKANPPVALEIQGGGHKGGHHSRHQGMTDDFEKLANAVLLGWMVFFATPEQASDGTALEWVEQALKG